MVTLKEGKILDSWASLLTSCQDEEEQLFQMVEERLAALEAPGVTWKRETVAPGFLKALKGKRRDFILVSNQGFSDYLVCIGIRGYGTSLDVSWYLIVSAKSLIMRLLSHIPFVGMFLRLIGQVRDLDVFDQQDLRAYLTASHHAVRRSVEKLIEEKKLDIEIDWKSRGMFGVA